MQSSCAATRARQRPPPCTARAVHVRALGARAAAPLACCAPFVCVCVILHLLGHLGGAGAQPPGASDVSQHKGKRMRPACGAQGASAQHVKGAPRARTCTRKTLYVHTPGGFGPAAPAPSAAAASAPMTCGGNARRRAGARSACCGGDASRGAGARRALRRTRGLPVARDTARVCGGPALLPPGRDASRKRVCALHLHLFGRLGGAGAQLPGVSDVSQHKGKRARAYSQVQRRVPNHVQSV